MSYWTEVDPPCSFIPENWNYEKKREFRYAELDYLHAAVDFPSFAGKKVLCVGDGAGIDALEFARNGAVVDVIDISEKAIDLTNKHFLQMRCKCPGVNGYVGDVSDTLPFSGQTFDAVYCFGVLHHITSVQWAVSEIARVLKPGGQFLGMVYNKDSLYYGYSILRRAEREGITPDEAMRLYSERNPGCPHSVAYTCNDMVKLLGVGKFSEWEISTYYPVIDLPTKRKVRFETSAGLGWHLFFKATK